MDKQIVGSSHSGMPLSNRKEWIIDSCNSTNEFQNNYLRVPKWARVLCSIPWALILASVVLAFPRAEHLDQKQLWLFFTAKVEFVIGKGRGIDLNLIDLKTSIKTCRALRQPSARDLGNRSEFANRVGCKAASPSPGDCPKNSFLVISEKCGLIYLRWCWGSIYIFL